jgi:glycosyltransferase involved in cell wall biosynthesis
MNKKVKVLECIRQGLIGGGESHLLVLVENMDRSKFDPVVLSFTEGPMIDRLNELGIKNHVISTQRPFDIRVWKDVKKLMVKEGIELVHVHGSRANSNVLSSARSLKIPVVYTVHGWSFHPDQNFLTRNLRVMGEKYLTSRSTVNISVSESNKQSGKKFIRDFDSVVINNGIDQQRFNPANKLKDIRKELGIGPDKMLLLFLARFTAHKQPLALLAAFARLVEKNKHFHLLMVGEGDQKEEAVDMIKKAGLEGFITLLPFRQDVPDVLASADIYILPSLWEGLPIGLLEAMAMGVPVIGSKVDGTSEVIDDGENGLFVDPDNLVNDLVEKIGLLAADAELRQKFKKTGISTIKEKYSALNMTRAIEELYETVLKNKN